MINLMNAQRIKWFMFICAPLLLLLSQTEVTANVSAKEVCEFRQFSYPQTTLKMGRQTLNYEFSVEGGEWNTGSFGWHSTAYIARFP